MGILKKHAGDNFFDSTWDNFEERLERGAFSHAAFPGWLLIRSSCLTCDASVTVIKYHGRRIELVPSGDEQMGRRWIIHQCPPEVLDQHGADSDEVERQQSMTWRDKPEPEYGEADDIAEAQAEAKGEIYPDDPNVRDGNGDIVAHFDWNDE